MPKEKKRWIIRIGDDGYFAGWSVCPIKPVIENIKGARRFSKADASAMSIGIAKDFGYSCSVGPIPAKAEEKVTGFPDLEERYATVRDLNDFPLEPTPVECTGCKKWEARFWKAFTMLDKSQERTILLLDKLEKIQESSCK